MPTTRPGLTLNGEGICTACVMSAQKRENIDWVGRERELSALMDKHRKSAPGVYDCIVPVSGGKDSMYQVHIVKEVYKMNPLCLTFRTLARTSCGEENLQSLRNMGVDHIDFSPNPLGINKLTRKAFEEFGDCSLVDHLAIYVIVPRFALQMNIPLVVWG